MNLVTHILKKDARHLRVLLILWLILVILQAALSGTGITSAADDMAMQTAFAMLAMIVPALQIILIIVIIPLLIHNEPLVGSKAFWFTRPMSSREVFASKCTFIGLLIILPKVLADILMMALNRITMGDILLAIPEILMYQLLLVMIVAVLAVVTENFARFAITGAGLYIVSMLVAMGMYIFRMLFKSEELVASINNPSLEQSKMVVFFLITIMAGLAVIIHQYQTRRTAHSYAIVFGVLVLMMFIDYSWRWNFLQAPKHPVDPAVIDVETVKATLNPRDFSVSDFGGMRPNQNTKKKDISGKVQWEGLPPGHFAQPVYIRASFETAEQKLHTYEKEIYNYDYYPRHQNMVALQETLGDLRIITEFHNYAPQLTLLRLPEEEYHLVAKTAGHFSAELETRIFKYEIVDSLPLVKGQKYEKGSEQALIVDVLRHTSGCTVLLREKFANLLFDTDDISKHDPPQYRRTKHQYFLVNRKLNEAFIPADDHDMMIDTFGENRNLIIKTHRFHFLSDARGGSFLASNLTDEWLADAELLRVEKVDAGMLTKSINIENFIINPAQRHQGFVGARAPGVRIREEPNLEALAKLTLPEQPSKDQVRKYISEIVRISAEQTTSKLRDPQIRMLVALGPEHFDVLLEFATEFHVQRAILMLAGPEHKELVLNKLKDIHMLARIVVDQGWEEGARETLLAVIRQQPDNLPPSWIRAVASFEDPATYDDLKACLIKSHQPNIEYDIIYKLPGIDLTESVTAAWKRVKYSNDWQIMEFLPVAIKHGHDDALNLAILYALRETGRPYPYIKKKIREAIHAHTDATGSDEEIRAWYMQHKGDLIFDPDQKKFIINERS